METAEDWADARPFDRGVADCGEVDLHYVADGSPDAPMVVLLHGFPECWYTWRHQLAPLAEEFRVVAPDLRGYNRSDRPEDVAAYALPRLRRDIYELIQRFDQGSAHLVGHDVGGALALSFARHHPGHVDRLVVANTLDPERVRAQVGGRQLLRSAYAAVFQLPWLPERLLAARGYALLRRTYAETAVPDAYTETDVERLRATWERDGALTAALNYYRAQGRAVLGRIATMPRASRIFVPSLVLWGDRDPALRPRVADTIAAGIDDPEVRRYEDATHWLHAEYPERFARDVADFLADGRLGEGGHAGR